MSFESYKQSTQRGLDKFNDTLSGGNAKQGDGAKTPYYVTGARCFIKLGGKPVGICQDFKWNVAYQGTPIQTIDTNAAWDIDVGQVTIQATLNKIYDPVKGPEAEGLFAIMSASVHQPMIEIQVIYQAPNLLHNSPKDNKDNTLERQMVEFSMFFARGMFVSVSGNATIGQVSNLSASFVGITYQHYAAQGFVPYGVAYVMAETLQSAKSLVSSFSGGFL